MKHALLKRQACIFNHKVVKFQQDLEIKDPFDLDTISGGADSTLRRYTQEVSERLQHSYSTWDRRTVTVNDNDKQKSNTCAVESVNTCCTTRSRDMRKATPHRETLAAFLTLPLLQQLGRTVPKLVSSTQYASLALAQLEQVCVSMVWLLMHEHKPDMQRGHDL